MTMMMSSLTATATRRGAAKRAVATASRMGVRAMGTLPPYLHETKIPTFHFQDSLPKLKVPKLEETLEKYEYFTKPMVSEEEFEQTRKAVAEFKSGAGPSLQEELIALDKKEYSSFYNQMWFDMYLKSRDPLPLNFNPQLTFVDETDPKKMDQAARTANLLGSSLRFYRTLEDGKLIPDIFHIEPKRSQTRTYEMVCSMLPRQLSFYGSYYFNAYPLDMSQYKGLFSSTRIPHQGRDEIRKFSAAQSKHVVVQRGTAFYTVQVLNDDMSIVDHETLERSIRSILQDDKNANAQPPLGALTTMERDAWADARLALEKNPANKATLEAIDSALFAVCLDEAKPESYQEIAGVMLHGNGRNRWFDKSFQLIVAANGKACVNFEHAWGDGVAVLRYFNEIHTDATAVPAREPVVSGIPEVVASGPSGADAGAGPAAAGVGVPKRLHIDFDGDLTSRVEKAGKDFDAVVSKLEVGTFETETFSKKSLKDLNVGGDGFMQMGFQLAHERCNGFTPATYESASTAAFKHGRTETIRSATPEAAAFAKAFCNDSVSDEERAKLLRTAIKRHGSITKDALMGKGMDRHLFALRVLAEQRDANRLPAIYTDKAYQVINKIILSTSTLSSDALFAGGFGPVNQDCYALAYGISNVGARTAVATYGLGSQNFADELEKAYQDMIEVLKKA
ncbi:Carnitine O-palmitoyltransferase 2, mitochondrial [Hondaea fermentalgiana]|uniref:Carnitine O-palmitoyltransferase 2, mitochondrial n=1 Tax=Hondaea fermentalgiana TaxID=2315210 RepID=A0A2R5GIL4_9STRA|nr:Carnitine O-palmitoyltransferase 2, mitochondrial [Hondaea fermentalgiana]|eukprot:GBG27714.1 Carnitine O-palmitoyltransferase 2, mitochondrial [Hondaea fermentalgiana]